MNNLTLVRHDKVELQESETVRFSKDKFGSKVVEILSSTKCCICDEKIWVEHRGHSVFSRYSFLVGDARAYIDGLPDYIKTSHALLECHYENCAKALYKKLNAGEYIIPLN